MTLSKVPEPPSAAVWVMLSWSRAPSSSCPGVTVTLCGVSQSLVVNVRDVSSRVRSEPVSVVIVTVTFSPGFSESLTV